LSPRGRGDPTEPLDVLGGRKCPDAPFQHVTFGRDRDIRWDVGDPELAGGLRIVPDVDLNGDVVGRERRGDVVAGKDLFLHPLARGTRLAPEVD
jgi:hypothetical protein